MLMAGRFTSLISPFFANINMRRLSVTNKLIAKCMQILSLLPPLEGKSVIELGASIVHYTIELEKKVDNVLVMDFIEGAIKRNEETNGHFKNVKFMCVDVTSPDLKIKPGSVDVVF